MIMINCYCPALKGLGKLAMSFCLLWTFSVTTASAKISKHLVLSKQDIARLKQIQKQLNKTKTVQARFIQLSSNGEYSEGQMFLERPGKLRLVYDNPNPLMVVADGKYISYVDRDLDEATTVLLSMTKAQLLLRKSFSFFSKDIIVSNFDKSPGFIKVVLSRADDSAEDNITLVFSDAPMELRKWVITDTQGITTTVSLTESKINIPIPREKFIYVPMVKPELETNN